MAIQLSLCATYDDWPKALRSIYTARSNAYIRADWILHVVGVELIRLEDEMRSREMSNRKNRKKQYSDGFKGFIACELTAERKRAFDAWEGTWEQVCVELESLIADGHKVTFGAMNDGKTVQCSVTCRNEDHPAYGWCMTSRAPTWDMALTVAVFKHRELLQGDWLTALPDENVEDWG